MLASRLGNAHAARVLIEAKADLEIKDHQGETALGKTVTYKKVEVQALLEQHGAQPPEKLHYHHGHHGHHGHHNHRSGGYSSGHHTKSHTDTKSKSTSGDKSKG